MKKWKQMLAIMLAVIMTLAMTVTASAAEQVQVGPTGTLTVEVNQNNTLENQTIKIYKLFDLTVEEKNYKYEVNPTYKATIENALGMPGTSTSKDLYEKLYASTSDEIQTFANAFTEKTLAGGLSETATSNKIVGMQTSYTFDNLAFGYYLVHQTGTEKLQSSLVSVDKPTGTEVNLKGTAPSIEKTADKETVEIGEVVTYTITGTIPDTTGYADYVYKIHDTLTDGLDFVKDQNGVALDEPKTALPVSVQIGVENAEPMNATLEVQNSRKMTLDLSEWVRKNQNKKGEKFTVIYYAKVNENAVLENKNNASLEYGNEPGSTTTTTPVEVTTPTYPLQIHKQIKGQIKSYLAGATFRLYRTEQDAKADSNPISVTGTAGEYKINPAKGEIYDMVSVDKDLGNGMNLKLNGLKAGDYWLVETKAPNGYHGVPTPIKITITESGTATVGDWTISKDDIAENDKIIDIENSTGTILPGTGGMGTILFTVVGVALILIVAVSFVISRRKRQEQE